MTGRPSEGVGHLRQLAELLRARNAIDRSISWLIGRPATPGNLGEWIAANIFDIELASNAVNPGYDGVFRSGPLRGRTVNIKRYSTDGSLLDISAAPADYYLVLSGPRPRTSSGPRHLPFQIDSIYLFEMASLRARLAERGIATGIATSVRRGEWEAARVFPNGATSPIALSAEQIEAIRSIALADSQ